eukprot:6525892-Prymnesium_polylepis.1
MRTRTATQAFGEAKHTLDPRCCRAPAAPRATTAHKRLPSQSACKQRSVARLASARPTRRCAHSPTSPPRHVSA